MTRRPLFFGSLDETARCPTGFRRRGGHACDPDPARTVSDGIRRRGSRQLGWLGVARRSALAAGGEGAGPGAASRLRAPRAAAGAARRAARAPAHRVAGAGRLRQDHRAGRRRPRRAGTGGGRRVDLARRRRYAEPVRQLPRRRLRARRAGCRSSQRPRRLVVVTRRAADGDAGAGDPAARRAVPAGARRGRPVAPPHRRTATSA